MIRPSSSACSASVILLALHGAAGGVLEVLRGRAAQRLVVLLDADDGVPVAGEHLGDAGTHGAQADDADGA